MPGKADEEQRLEHKIRIISPAIDMIELIAARGNTSLESAVNLTKELRLDIQSLSQQLAKAAASSVEYQTGSSRNQAALKAENEEDMKLIIYDMKKLLTRIEDAVPLINLALSASGAKLSTQLPSTVSPSRLLQASNCLTAGDAQYMASPHRIAQIGPTLTLSVYMLFAGHDRPETEDDMRQTTWKEVIHKARVKLRRVPLDVVMSTGSGSEALQSHEISTSHKTPQPSESPEQVRAEARSDEFAYQIVIVEDFDDDRVHDFEDEEAKPGPFDDVRMAGIRETIPVHEISKIFYADTSKVLNISMDAESNHPVLLLRRDVQALPPRRMVHEEKQDGQESNGAGAEEGDGDGKPQTEEEKQRVQEDHKDRKSDPWRLPSSLDPEWIAFEVYTEAESADDVSDEEFENTKDDFTTPGEEPDSQLSLSLSTMNINGSPSVSQFGSTPLRPQVQQSFMPQIKTSLSMLELLLRLTSLQQFQQQSHLSIPDELLNFFLEESASTGAGGDEKYRQAVRADARKRVGWDPYDESPIKRRGENYQYYQSPSVGEQYSNAETPASQYYRSPSVREQYDGAGTPGNRVTESTTNSPGGFQAQTKSVTSTPESRSRTPLSPMSSYNQVTSSIHRPAWMKRQGDVRTSSPLKPNTTHSDEGIGTSPGSVPGNGEDKEPVQ